MDKLLKKKESILASMRALVDAANSKGDTFTEEQTKEYQQLKADLKAVNDQITLISDMDLDAEEAALASQKKAEAERGTELQAAGRFTAPYAPAPEAKKEFSSFGEFLHAAMFNKNDQRLVYGEPSRDVQGNMSMGEGSGGGFAVPDQFRNEIMSIEQEQGIMRAGATVIPAGSPPDSALTVPALDQEPAAGSTANKMYGGVQVSWIEEGGAKPQTDIDLRAIKLEPKEVAAYVPVTDKLLRNWQAAETFISSLLRKAVIAAEDEAFIAGNGVGKPLGIIPSGAAYDYNRASGGAIGLADIKGMYTRFAEIGGNIDNAIWLTSRSAFPELLDITGDGGGATNVIEVDKDTKTAQFYGMPVIRHGRGLSALGTKGDLVLVDRSAYLIKDGSGPFVAASEHVQFVNNKTLIKVFWNVDGQPWLTKPFRDEKDYEVSPIVVLDVPA